MTKQILVEELHNLEIFFCKIQPEMLFDGCRFYNDKLSYNSIDDSTYLSCFDAITFNLTRDEIRNRYCNVKKSLEDNNGVWGLLNHCGTKMLENSGEEPRCRIEYAIPFSEIGQAIAQDHVVLAWMAHSDWQSGKNRLKQETFTWPAILRSDDARLNSIIEKGLAENHYHLNGSTQNFALTWAALMNNPEMISSLMNNNAFKELLLERIIPLEGLEVQGQVALLKQAALIRALLFGFAVGEFELNDITEKWRRYSVLPFSHNIDRIVTYLKWNYGEKFRQVHGNQKTLDYALSKKLFELNTESNVRLLSGERALLYVGFLNSFSNVFGEEINNLLYYYLIIKIQFRRLFIQVNKVKGFDNFSAYQDRKDVIYAGFDEYGAEALRMSVKSPIEDNHVSSLEARIMPKDSASTMAEVIRLKDEIVLGKPSQYDKEKDDKEKCDKQRSILNNYFYVLHFPKKKLKVDEKNVLNNCIRNRDARRIAEYASKSTVCLLKENPRFSERICGIDACSHEIGCRPETYATEYRYVRNEVHLGLSYHVGEDYLDICDGLRAIDEAIRFLELGRGDRLGHALALGVSSEEYYKKKHYMVYMPKQDVLDNYVWLMERSHELGVRISPESREKMNGMIHRLMGQIYGYDNAYTINDYYDSWKLRGDHPSLYSGCGCEEDKSSYYEEEKRSYIDYNRYKASSDEDLETIRSCNKATKLYHKYHYDGQAMVVGSNVIGTDIEKWYVQAMTDMQNALMKKISQKGIVIECNPTSNKLIGSFDHYEEHPILRFNNTGLNMDIGSNDLMVTINTDDLGVFDTSLENEYAVMFQAMVNQSDSYDKLTKEEIYQYLERMREMGFIVAFKKKGKENETVANWG